MRPLLCAAPLLVAASLLVACVDALPSGPATGAPGAPRATVTPTTAFVKIESGSTHSCALDANGQAYCWGRNPMGELGDTTFTNSSVPVAVIQAAGVTFTDITAGSNFTCAVDTTSQAWCWGNNGDSRLGDSTTTPRNAPVQVLPVGGVALVTVRSGGAHTCGLTSAGQAYCWGTNMYGQIGNGTTVSPFFPTAVSQPAGVTFTEIHAADRYTCALDTGGQAYCWGYGGDGAIGNNSLIGPKVPTAVQQPAGVTFVAIDAQSTHTCGLTSGGQAYCWGRNDFGQLGDGTTTLSPKKTPVAVSHPAGVTFASISANGAFTCARTSAGQEYCWGANNRGQLGNGTTTASNTPVAVSQPAGVTFSQLSTGSAFACAIDGIGQTWCWGHNLYGMLGNGTTTNSSTPVAVSH